MVVAHRCLTISLMETSYCSARNNAFDGDFGKNFWQKRDWSTFCHIPVATVISPLHMWFKKEKNIRRKKTQLIELLLVPRYFFVNISTNSLQIWGSFIVIPLNKLKLMTLNSRVVKAAWLAKHIRALSQCSHHTNLVEKYSKAGLVPVTIFSHGSKHFWHLPLPIKTGIHSMQQKSIIFLFCGVKFFHLQNTMFCFLKNRNLFF